MPALVDAQRVDQEAEAADEQLVGRLVSLTCVAVLALFWPPTAVGMIRRRRWRGRADPATAPPAEQTTDGRTMRSPTHRFTGRARGTGQPHPTRGGRP